MDNPQVDVIALQNKARDILITSRAVQEQKFEQWYTALLKCSKEKFLDKIPFDYTGWSLQKMIPEWYVEHPDGEKAKEQVAAFNAKVAQINALANELNMTGVKLIEEFNNANK